MLSQSLPKSLQHGALHSSRMLSTPNYYDSKTISLDIGNLLSPTHIIQHKMLKLKDDAGCNYTWP